MIPTSDSKTQPADSGGVQNWVLKYISLVNGRNCGRLPRLLGVAVAGRRLQYAMLDKRRNSWLYILFQERSKSAEKES